MFTEFSTTFRVRMYELGDDGRIGHGVFLQWFEEAAIQASAAAGYGLAAYEELQGAWVMRDIDVEFLDSPRYDEEVNVTTWVSDFRRVRSHREYVARRTVDQAVLARGRAEWVFLDTRTLMPRRLSAEMVAQFDANGIAALEPVEWPASNDGESLGQLETAHGVLHREIDQMHHVNNVIYVEWIEQQMIDAAKAWKLDGAAAPRRHYVQYRQAAQEGDTLRLTSQAVRCTIGVVWQHLILRGDTVLVQALSQS